MVQRCIPLYLSARLAGRISFQLNSGRIFTHSGLLKIKSYSSSSSSQSSRYVIPSPPPSKPYILCIGWRRFGNDTVKHAAHYLS